MNLGDSRIKYPTYEPAVAWIAQVVAGETQILVATDFFAADFLADQALAHPDPDLCEDCGMRQGLELAYRYQPDGQEHATGLQN